MRSALVAVLFGWAAPGAFANGGTFDTSSVWRTGNLEPVRQNKIELAEEALHIAIDGEFAEVKVDYRLVNRGGAVVLTYGFPVDVNPAEIFSESESLRFVLSDGDRALVVEKILEKESALIGRKRVWKSSFPGRPVRKWHLVTLKFLPRETKTLHVSYRVKNLGQMSGISTTVFWDQTPREFLYALHPSGTWGTGKVGKLSIVADLRKLRAMGVPITEVSLPGFTERDGVYRWELSDYDLRQKPDLRIVYDLGAQLRSKAAQDQLLPRSSIESVRASSTREPSRTTKATYGVDHLLDRDFSTAWIEGVRGPGVGEWIEVRFKKNTRVRFVALANGYWKSPERLAENGCLRKVRLDWTWGGDAGDLLHRGKESEIVDLVRPAYGPAMVKFPYGTAEVLQEFGEMGVVNGIRSLRLTILEAEPGTKASDAAVSELIFGTECGE